MTRHRLVTLVLALVVLGPMVSSGATLRRVGFDEMVQQATLVVHGRVLKTESVQGSGASLRRADPAKDTRAPASKPQSAAPDASTPAPATPISAGTRGGRMIFTIVTMESLSVIKGTPPRTVEFAVAGGTVDGRTAVVPGMPRFATGEQYVVFLRGGFEASADPIVGVNQGLFRVVPGSDGGPDVVLNADSDYVIGVENGQVVLRHNAASASVSGHGARVRPGPPPTPAAAGSHAAPSAEVQRYWFSTEPALTVAQFATLVRARLGR